MNKALFLFLLTTTILYPNKYTQAEIDLKIQQEKDLQQYRMEQLKVYGAISITLIAALVQIYMAKK